MSVQARLPVDASDFASSKPIVIDQAAKLRALAAQVTACDRVRRYQRKGRCRQIKRVRQSRDRDRAQSGKRVILIDADLGLANADVLCNIDVKSNLAHVVARQRELKDVMVDAPGGFKMICGAIGPGEDGGPFGF